LKKAVFITGPVQSSGRSGLSWGSMEASKWDTIFWDATKDIAFNVERATSLGFKCFFFYWANDEIANNLHIPNLELLPIVDPFYSMDIQFTTKDLPELIRELGPLAKNSTYNDQRQAFAAQFGFNYLLELGFEIALRIRSDQRMNWVELSTDLMFAYNSKRILFPAQKSLTSLDAVYTGFSVMDFFYGGETQILSAWFNDVIVGGRLYGPHQDIAWKPLINSAKWKSFFPGLSILSDINNLEKQTIMAEIFWQEFATPSSKETMNQIVWRGNKLGVIDYRICRTELFSNKTKKIEPHFGVFIPGSHFPANFEWDLVTNYLIGGTPTGSSKKMIQNDIMLNHLNYVLNSGKYEKSNINLQILALLLLSRFPVIHRLVIYGKKIISKLMVNR
jgi:hypothetical protein